jgi:hypothetical protein
MYRFSVALFMAERTTTHLSDKRPSGVSIFSVGASGRGKRVIPLLLSYWMLMFGQSSVAPWPNHDPTTQDVFAQVPEPQRQELEQLWKAYLLWNNPATGVTYTIGSTSMNEGLRKSDSSAKDTACE